MIISCHILSYISIDFCILLWNHYCLCTQFVFPHPNIIRELRSSFAIFSLHEEPLLQALLNDISELTITFHIDIMISTTTNNTVSTDATLRTSFSFLVFTCLSVASSSSRNEYNRYEKRRQLCDFLEVATVIVLYHKQSWIKCWCHEHCGKGLCADWPTQLDERHSNTFCLIQTS